jgi:fatty acid desaturase
MSTAITATGEKPLTSAELRELSVRSDLQGAIRTISHYGAIAVAGALIWLVSTTYGLAWALPLIVVQAYFVAFLFMPETAHKTAFHSRALNLVVGHLSAFVIANRYEYYCLFHWDHHRYTQDPQRDPELIVGPKPSSDTQLAIAYTGLVQLAGRELLMLRHALTGKVALPWVPESKRHIVVREARLYLTGYVLLLLASLALHTAILLWVWIVPLLLGQLILRP